MPEDKPFNLSEEEEKVLKFWKESKIFEKSLENRKSSRRPFVFYEGPPYANGKPGIHHVLARIYKDIILRYKSMRGFYVPRKAGWDTHGLPVEIAAEKALGLKSKKDIEKFGIARFNEEAKKAVWIYKDEWENLTERIGYWLDLKNAYITCSSDYVETLWWVLARISKRGLLYKAHKVVPWCPRCGTALSSHELAQGYKEVEDQSAFVKFKLEKGQKIGKDFVTDDKTYILSWTTTPWTLPGNVALAVGGNIQYEIASFGKNSEYKKEKFIFARDLHDKILNQAQTTLAMPENNVLEFSTLALIRGKDLVSLKYEPLFDIPKLQNEKSHRIYEAGFVTTTEGTGVVHTAVMYGEDDYELGKKVGLPQHHTVDEEGRFTKEVKGFEGLKVKDKETEEKIINYLKTKNYLLKTKLYRHEYPFCWRCGSAVLYYARTSWFIAMSKLRKNLLKSNETINWVPSHVKEGRFGEWLKEAKDWNLSRERYWGTPMPVWECAKCGETEVVGGLDELDKLAGGVRNKYWIMRHGESEGIIRRTIDSGDQHFRLTTMGRDQIRRAVQKLKKEKIDVIFTSDLPRAKESAEIAAKELGVKKIVIDKRLREIFLAKLSGSPVGSYSKFIPNIEDRFTKTVEGGETLRDIRTRVWDFLREVDKKYSGKNILVASHEDTLWMFSQIANGWTEREAAAKKVNGVFMKAAEVIKLNLKKIPRDVTGGVDMHRPYVDEIVFPCKKCLTSSDLAKRDKGKMARIKEVADVWFDSGAMPLAQMHFPFAQIPNSKSQIPNKFDEKKLIKEIPFPADYISEAMDQTRGWFYTLLSVATAMGYEAPYKNVISLGLINDKFGHKMSKSKGNIVDPWEIIKKYGVDAVRWYFYTGTPPGEPKNFDENEIAKAYRKFHLILWNSVVFYKTYGEKVSSGKYKVSSKNILDKWIIARLNEAIADTSKNLEKYQVREAAFAIESLLDDLSRWYIRRSRRRFSGVFKQGASGKDEKDYVAASRTLEYVLYELAKIISPFTPFFGEIVYAELGKKDGSSIHLTDWPKADTKLIDRKLIEAMAEIRRLASIALAKRLESGVKVRQPLQKLLISKAKLKIPKFKELIDILKEEVNVKEVIFSSEVGGDAEIRLDTEITPALKEEGTMRDFVRMIQELRQSAGMKAGQEIELMFNLPDLLKAVVSKNEKLLKSEVSAKKIDYKKSAKFTAEIETKIDGMPVWVGLEKSK